MNKEELEKALAQAKAENARLKAKSKPKVKVPGLPGVIDHNPEIMAAPDDICHMLKDAGLYKEPKITDAYHFINLFKLVPYAQMKIEGKRGIGTRLFLAGDVEDAIKHLLSFAGLSK